MMNRAVPVAGRSDELAPGVVRICAPNASAMTGPGTNSYVLGHGPYAIVDPAVDDRAHRDRLIAAADGDIQAVILTHRHPDHADGAVELAQASGAPLLAWPKTVFGAHDRPVRADVALRDDQRLAIGGLEIIVHRTPGHAADHVALELPVHRLLLAGDTLMQAVTVVIPPPDGSMTAYFATLDRLAGLDVAAVAPGHGGLLIEPAAEIAAVSAHRRKREAQIAAALSSTEGQSDHVLAARLYPDLDARLRPVAVEQIRAHLIRLAELGRACATDSGWLAVA